MDAKAAGDLVYLLGVTRDELGGSEYYAIHGHTGRNVPTVDAASALARYRAVNAAQSSGLIASCHDLSDGGLGVALAETAFAGGFGMNIDLARVPADGALRDEVLLFSESASRLLVTVRPENRQRFEALFAGQLCGCLGAATADVALRITGVNGNLLVNQGIADFKEAWQSPLREM
jgi:phosphoribosylformylglycinamidine synthase